MLQQAHHLAAACLPFVPSVFEYRPNGEVQHEVPPSIPFHRDVPVLTIHREPIHVSAPRLVLLEWEPQKAQFDAMFEMVLDLPLQDVLVWHDYHHKRAGSP